MRVFKNRLGVACSGCAEERALASADAGLALITGATADDVRVRDALRATRGRILMNLNRSVDAAAGPSGPRPCRYMAA